MKGIEDEFQNSLEYTEQDFLQLSIINTSLDASQGNSISLIVLNGVQIEYFLFVAIGITLRIVTSQRLRA